MVAIIEAPGRHGADCIALRATADEFVRGYTSSYATAACWYDNLSTNGLTSREVPGM